MASSSQKKTTSTSAKKSSSKNGGSKSGSKSSGSKGGSKSSTARSSGKRAAQPRPIRREVCGAVLLVLALFALVSYFQVSAIFIDLFAGLLKGLLGYGYWLSAPALACAGIVLLFHHGRPVRLRAACILLLPLLLGGLGHMLFCKESLESSVMQTLWETGGALHSGGVLAGALAMGCVAVFSKVASVILYVALLAVLLMLSMNLTLDALVGKYKGRVRYEEEEVPATTPAIPKRQKEEGRRRIDIPLDDEEMEAPVQQPVKRQTSEPVKESEKASGEKKEGRFTSFFRHKSDQQKTPVQLLEEQEEIRPAPADPEPSMPVETPAPVAEPVATPKVTPIVTPTVTPTVTPAITTEGKEPPVEPLFAAPVAPKPVAEPVIPTAPVFAAPVTPPPVRAAETQPVRPPLPVEKEPSAAATKKEVEQQAAAVNAEIEERLAGESEEYQFPPITLLRSGHGENPVEAGAELRNNSRRLTETLNSFGVDAKPGDVVHGPSVTRYEFVLEQGVKLSKITNLADDIALALGAVGVRIAPVPDKSSVVGVEVPNKRVTPVLIRDVIESQDFVEHKSETAFSLGRDIGGNNVIGDIKQLPHVLIAGTTGSGKSVCTNSLIISLLYKSAPDEVRFIMVDPKMVELAPYNGIPHLLIPVVTDPKKAAGALQWAVTEMMKRYKTFSEYGVKKLEEFNNLAQTSEELETLPSLVVVIDELADLMLVAAKEVEESICRVAQMGRAAGVHLVIATQRPSADVITGLMKANIPSRIAFAVASSLESRIILDNTGAEKLVGKGDMLYSPQGAGKPQRVQGCFISPEEIEEVVRFVKSNSQAQYSDEVMAKIEESVQEKEKGGKASKGSAAPEPAGDESDELLPAAIDVVLETGQASVSMLQRRLKLGYSRAARLVDQMEERGIVGPFEGSKPRQLLITRAQWQEMQMGGQPAPEEEAPPVPEEEA